MKPKLNYSLVTIALIAGALLTRGCVRNTVSEDKQTIQKLEKKVDLLDRDFRELKTNYFKSAALNIEVLQGMEKMVSHVEDNQVSADCMKDPNRVWQALSNLNNYISRVDAQSVKKEAAQK